MRLALRWTSALVPLLAGAALAQPPPAGVPERPASRVFLYQGEATSILGRQVLDPAGSVVGRIVDVLVGDAGLPRAAVIDFGGFLGVGNRRVAVAWGALAFNPTARTITLDMTVDQLKAVPQFRQPEKPADPPASVATPPARQTQPAPRP